MAVESVNDKTGVVVSRQPTSKPLRVSRCQVIQPLSAKVRSLHSRQPAKPNRKNIKAIPPLAPRH